MAERGFVISEPDQRGGDRTFIGLAPVMSSALRSYLSDMIEGA